MKKISIIIPAYNAEKYLDECLASIHSQKMKEIEVFIINDGSTDKTLSILKKWEKIDNRFEIINQSNQGVSKSRNKAIQLATGKYILFVDSDDSIEENTLDKIYKEAEKNKCELLCFGYNICYKDKQIKIVDHSIKNTSDCIDGIVLGNSIKGFLCNKLFINKIIKDNNLYLDESIHFCEDLLFVIQYLDFCKKISYVTESFYNYRMRRSSVTFNTNNIKNVSILKSYENLLQIVSDEKYKNEFIYQYIFNYYKYRKLIQKEKIDINYNILKEEKKIMKNITKAKKIKLTFIKKTPALYSKLVNIKNKHNKLYD